MTGKSDRSTGKAPSILLLDRVTKIFFYERNSSLHTRKKKNTLDHCTFNFVYSLSSLSLSLYLCVFFVALHSCSKLHFFNTSVFFVSDSLLLFLLLLAYYINLQMRDISGVGYFGEGKKPNSNAMQRNSLVLTSAKYSNTLKKKRRTNNIFQWCSILILKQKSALPHFSFISTLNKAILNFTALKSNFICFFFTLSREL